MRIKILGTGGAINDGLPYNSFIVDNCLLVETPPDIMNSLYREGIDRRNISTIYISHFHGDHCFGLPFLLLKNFFDGYTDTIHIKGPAGIKKWVLDICSFAFGPENRMQDWVRTHIISEEVIEGRCITLGRGYSLTPIRMFHSAETYGFTLESQGKRLLYIADSSWDNSLLSYMDHADAVLIDLNGEKSDIVKVHISEEELAEHALPRFKDKKIIFYGTHLRANKVSDIKQIHYLQPGDEIVIT
ncbi:MAG: MBL fold metallo-hydrolase [Deltaproteobacteria bacterium]|nr:MBL fold metallo-hydrolase [Deltaproteobacteria bacterium]